MVYQGMDDFYIDLPLDNGTTYYYAAFAFNQSFEYSKIPATDAATPNSQGGDLTWQAMTIAQLKNQENDCHVVIWAWGDGVSDSTEEEINTYLQAMSLLEQSYQGIYTGTITINAQGANKQFHR